jgi:hypothetical protein
VVLAVEVIGGELADLAFRVRRTVRAEDPTDLASPLHYAVEVRPEDPDEDGPAGELKPSRRWVLAALRDGGAMQSVAQLGDRTAADGHQLKAWTIQEALNDLEAADLAVIGISALLQPYRSGGRRRSQPRPARASWACLRGEGTSCSA